MPYNGQPYNVICPLPFMMRKSSVGIEIAIFRVHNNTRVVPVQNIGAFVAHMRGNVYLPQTFVLLNGIVAQRVGKGFNQSATTLLFGLLITAL